jgi:hypothetical protein
VFSTPESYTESPIPIAFGLHTCAAEALAEAQDLLSKTKLSPLPVAVFFSTKKEYQFLSTPFKYFN